jgi:hypothetical protein
MKPVRKRGTDCTLCSYMHFEIQATLSCEISGCNGDYLVGLASCSLIEIDAHDRNIMHV